MLSRSIRNLTNRRLLATLALLMMLGAGLAWSGGAPAVLAAGAPAAQAASSQTLDVPAAVRPPIAGVLDIPVIQAGPKVDGFCTEYDGALVKSFDDSGDQPGAVYLQSDGNFLYVCMVAPAGTFDSRFGSLYLDPQGDGQSYDFAQKDDFSLRVNITETQRMAYQGTGVSNGYVPVPDMNPFWEGMAHTDGKTDVVEWSVNMSVDGFNLGRCGALFGVAVYHHWFGFVGNDYGWPSNQWFDQPRTWQLARLDTLGCNERGNIAYVYRGNGADALSFYNLLTAHGYTVDLIPLNTVTAASDFSVYSLILIADDTGWLDQWGLTGMTSDQVNAIKAPNKPIVGLGEGGYAFFGKLSLFIGWPQGWHGPDADTADAGGSLSFPLFNGLTSPVTAYMNPVNTVAIYTLPSTPSDVVVGGYEEPPTNHANEILQGCRMLWGFGGNPWAMTGDGKTLFLNTVGYMNGFNNQCPREIPIPPDSPCVSIIKTAVPAAGTTVHPGDVIEYTITYIFSDDPTCNNPEQARISDYVPMGTVFVPGSASDGISPGPDGLLAWSITRAAGSQTKTFKVQVVDAACTIGQISNQATLHIPGAAPLTSTPVTHPVDCGPIHLPNDEPMYAEEEVNIYPYPLVLGHPSDIEVTLVNNSAVSQTVTVTFQTSPDKFGIGLTFTAFDSDVITIPAHGSAIAHGVFTPDASGHYCIQIMITGPNLPRPLYTQRNLDVTENLQAGVPDILTFMVGNPTANIADVMLVVDNTCPGWSAAITNPAGGVLAGMAPNEVRQAALEVTPPNPVTLGSGCHIDVQGWIGDQMIGGIRKLDVPPVHLPTDVNPPWEEREISVNPDPPVVGVPGQICVELQNPLAVTTTVTIVYQVADFGAGIGFTPVGSQTVELPPNSIAKYCIPWTPSLGGTLHRCILVTLQQPGYQDMHSQRNVDLRKLRLSELIGTQIPFTIGNPDLVTHTLQLVPKIYGVDSFFDIHFQIDPGDPPPDLLGPGQTLNLNMILIGLQNRASAAAPTQAFGDVHKIVVSVLLDGVEVGGFTVQLDVQPELPPPSFPLYLPLIVR